MTSEILDLTFFSDESWIHLSGYVNGQNSRHWSTSNPHAYVESSLHPIKIGIWVAISPKRIIGPIFFEDNLNSHRFGIIFNEFTNQLTSYERKHCWFQQDSATCHTSRESLKNIKKTFKNRVISKDLWPPRSPDLTPLDYFLFGYLKNKIFKNLPHTMDDLKQSIVEVISNINMDKSMLEKIFRNMIKRVDLCKKESGKHFEHLL